MVGSALPYAPMHEAQASFRTHASEDTSLHRCVELGEQLDLETFASIAHGRARLTLTAETRDKLDRSVALLQTLIDEHRVVYGITTGFGPLADRDIGAAYIRDLQRNLIYHLATGVGTPLGWAEARATLLARLMAISRGHSGASALLVDMMVRILNSEYAPLIPEKGTVGASGDLTPLAHVALAFMGQGQFIARCGTRHGARPVLSELGLQPYCFENRDGLALVNGTSCMTGLAALNGIDSARALSWAITLSVAHGEVFGARLEAWSPALANVRPHPGQIAVTQRLHDATGLGERFDRTPNAAKMTTSVEPSHRRQTAAQDPYSVRCVPQILGAIQDVMTSHDATVAIELHSVSDNPVLCSAPPYAIHGGNFMGQHVAFASDYLALALIQMATLAERQIAWLVDEKQNRGLLPPFLQARNPGLQSGFMGAQVTATALVAEMRTRAMPASVQSIPTNGNNQDIVSMGTIAARRTRALLDDLFRVLAIQALALAQAHDILSSTSEARSHEAAGLHAFVRARHATLEDDRPLSEEIESLAVAMRTLHFRETAQEQAAAS